MYFFSQSGNLVVTCQGGAQTVLLLSWLLRCCCVCCVSGGGNGLFTSRLFHKNELITEYFGPIIDHKKAKKLRKQNKHSHVRVLTIQFQYIDGIKHPRPGVGGASFANDARDSQKNNAVFVCR